MAGDTRSDWRKKLEAWLDSNRIQYVITAVIALNSITLGLETSTTVMNKVGGAMHLLDQAFLVFYVVELIVRFVATGFRFFRSAWNIFDLVIIGMSIVPAGESLRVFRALRILRALRLVRMIPRLRRIVEGVLRVLPDLGWVFVLMMLIYYVFAVVGTKLFGVTNPDDFGTLGRTYFTLFQVMTLEAWASGVARPLFEKHPFAYVYFISYLIISTFVVMNMVIAVVVNAFQGAMHGDPPPVVPVEKPRDVDPIDLEKEIKRLNRKLNRLYRLMEGQRVPAAAAPVETQPSEPPQG